MAQATTGTDCMQYNTGNKLKKNMKRCKKDSVCIWENQAGQKPKFGKCSSTTDSCSGRQKKKLCKKAGCKWTRPRGKGRNRVQGTCMSTTQAPVGDPSPVSSVKWEFSSSTQFADEPIWPQGTQIPGKMDKWDNTWILDRINQNENGSVWQGQYETFGTDNNALQGSTMQYQATAQYKALRSARFGAAIPMPLIMNYPQRYASEFKKAGASDVANYWGRPKWIQYVNEQAMGLTGEGQGGHKDAPPMCFFAQLLNAKKNGYPDNSNIDYNDPDHVLLDNNGAARVYLAFPFEACGGNGGVSDLFNRCSSIQKVFKTTGNVDQAAYTKWMKDMCTEGLKKSGTDSGLGCGGVCRMFNSTTGFFNVDSDIWAQSSKGYRGPSYDAVLPLGYYDYCNDLSNEADCKLSTKCKWDASAYTKCAVVDESDLTLIPSSCSPGVSPFSNYGRGWGASPPVPGTTNDKTYKAWFEGTPQANPAYYKMCPQGYSTTTDASGTPTCKCDKPVSGKCPDSPQVTTEVTAPLGGCTRYVNYCSGSNMHMDIVMGAIGSPWTPTAQQQAGAPWKGEYSKKLDDVAWLFGDREANVMWRVTPARCDAWGAWSPGLIAPGRQVNTPTTWPANKCKNCQPGMCDFDGVDANGSPIESTTKCLPPPCKYGNGTAPGSPGHIGGVGNFPTNNCCVDYSNWDATTGMCSDPVKPPPPPVTGQTCEALVKNPTYFPNGTATPLYRDCQASWDSQAGKGKTTTGSVCCGPTGATGECPANSGFSWEKCVCALKTNYGINTCTSTTGPLACGCTTTKTTGLWKSDSGAFACNGNTPPTNPLECRQDAIGKCYLTRDGIEMYLKDQKVTC